MLEQLVLEDYLPVKLKGLPPGPSVQVEFYHPYSAEAEGLPLEMQQQPPGPLRALQVQLLKEDPP